jgi:hypothetical protein
MDLFKQAGIDHLLRQAQTFLKDHSADDWHQARPARVPLRTPSGNPCVKLPEPPPREAPADRL